MKSSQSLKVADLLERLRALARQVRLSKVEAVFLASALFFAAFVISFYLVKTRPRQAELSNLYRRREIARMALNKKAQQLRDVEAQRINAGKILDSLKEFETRLKTRLQGYTQIIDEVNQLARKHSVVISGGIQFRSDNPEVTEAMTTALQQPRRHDQKLSVYPSLAIETTVEGDYHNLRRFISDLERSSQFVIINALALQGVEENARRLPRGAQPAGGSAAMTVALKIEMDTYFQKLEVP
jgi:Tfp pilus assembly protein PilO